MAKLIPYYQRDGITIYCGDCLDVMRKMPDNFVDTVITDPPYGLSFMGKHWDHGIPGPIYWREALRVAKPGATLMAFGGTRTHHRLACAIEDAGWEIRDCVTYFHDGNQAEAALMASLNEEQLAAYLELHYPNHQMSWVYGSGFPKSHNVSKAIDKSKGAEREVVGESPYKSRRPNPMNGTTYNYNSSKFDCTKDLTVTTPATPLAAKWDGWGSALKPAFEPIIVAMAPMPGSYAENAEAWGVAGLNIDGARIPTNGRPERVLDAKDTNNTAYAGRMNGSLAGGSKAVGETTQGRYPANVILSGEPQTEAEFAKAGVRKGSVDQFFTPHNNFGGHSLSSSSTIKGGQKEGYNDSGSASRYFAHCPPDTEPARLHYCPKAPPSERATPGNDHPTQKPLSLMRYLAKLTRTPDGGIVLDPFAGSGTTALAAIAEGRAGYILIEKEPAYADLCRRRIAEYTGAEIVPKEIETKRETVKQLGLW